MVDVWDTDAKFKSEKGLPRFLPKLLEAQVDDITFFSPSI